MKETVAGKGFELDTKTYTITVDSNGNISINNGAEVDNNGKAFIYKDAFYKFILLLKKHA